MFVDGSPSPFGPTKQLYMCIADGVGSWREYGVDPRQFSHGYENPLHLCFFFSIIYNKLFIVWFEMLRKR